MSWWTFCSQSEMGN